MCTTRNPRVQGNTLTITQGFFYQLLYTNQYFLKTTLLLPHIQKQKHTHTQITEEPIFISGLLPLKTGVLIGYLNNLKHFNISKNSSHKRNAKLETVMNNLN